MKIGVIQKDKYSFYSKSNSSTHFWCLLQWKIAEEVATIISTIISTIIFTTIFATIFTEEDATMCADWTTTFLSYLTISRILFSPIDLTWEKD